jgi:hypothetical protein
LLKYRPVTRSTLSKRYKMTFDLTPVRRPVQKGPLA